MTGIINPPPQAPPVFPYWETWLGFQINAAGVATVAPLIGNIASTAVYVPVIRNFTTVRFAWRATTTTAGPPVAWTATLFKNGVAAAFALTMAWATAPAVAQTTRLWTDGLGNRTPIDFARGDNWGISIAGGGVDNPNIICMFDMWGKWHLAGGLST